MLVLSAIAHSWPTGRALLRGVDLRVDPGQSVAIMGPSGSGKSTLLAIVGGLIEPTGGTLALAGRAITTGRDRHWLGSQIGWVQQTSNVLGRRDALDNVAVALHRTSLGRADRYRAAAAALAEVGLSEADNRVVSTLSGGEVQRVVIARALVARPRLLLADEPTGQLDADTSVQVTEMMVSTGRNQHCIVVVVTHDPEVAKRCDRCWLLNEGRLEPVCGR